MTQPAPDPFGTMHATLAVLGETANRIADQRNDLLAALREVEDYFADRADAEYHTDSPSPTGNEEMTMLVMVREAIAKATRKP